MKSKIDYHVLTMDEIVFDNRNKAYGAFIVRQHYERNLLKAIFLSIGIFGLAMSSPAILKNLGWIAKAPAEIFKEITLAPENFPGTTLPPRKTETTEKAATKPHDKSEERVAVKKDDLPKETEKTKETGTSTTDPNKPTGSDNGGISAGTGGEIKEDEIKTVYTPMVYNIKTVEQMPEFIGGQPAFEEFVQDNIIYPADEKIDEVEGTVKIQFIVTEDGAIQNVGLFKTSGNPNFDKEALRLVKSLPKYKPGRQNGVAVKVFCVLPIHFIIE